MYNDAGVKIHIHKIGSAPSDEDIDFNFLVAKALGCVAITTERNEELARRLAPFADKHKVWVAFHNHTDNVPAIDRPDPILELGKYIGFNLDIGHYFAGTKGKSPVPVIEKYYDRIISLHLKDRTADGRNLSWGKGQTPIKEVLPVAEEGAVADIRRHRAGVPGPGRLRLRQGSRDLPPVLQGRTGVSLNLRAQNGDGPIRHRLSGRIPTRASGVNFRSEFRLAAASATAGVATFLLAVLASRPLARRRACRATEPLAHRRV
jgi:hypothetical protein